MFVLYRAGINSKQFTVSCRNPTLSSSHSTPFYKVIHLHSIFYLLAIFSSYSALKTLHCNRT